MIGACYVISVWLFAVSEAVEQRQLLLLIHGSIHHVEGQVEMSLNIFVLQEFPNHIGTNVAVLRIVGITRHNLMVVAKAEG